MRVSSPIGDLPFEPRHLRYSSKGIEVTGAMGAWPAQVHLDVSDVPAILRMLRVPLIVMCLALALLKVAHIPGRSRKADLIGKGVKD